MVSEGTTNLAGNEEYVIDALKLYISVLTGIVEIINEDITNNLALFFSFHFWAQSSKRYSSPLGQRLSR